MCFIFSYQVIKKQNQCKVKRQRINGIIAFLLYVFKLESIYTEYCSIVVDIFCTFSSVSFLYIEWLMQYNCFAATIQSRTQRG